MPKLEEVYKEPDRLAIVAEFPGLRPMDLFRFWIDPVLICRWWPPSAQIEAKTGGSYVLNWPMQNWFLRGKIVEIEPGAVLAFTWHWDHEPEKSPTTVRVTFEPMGKEGTRLTLTHGDYRDDAEQRKGHLEGWLYFLGRLQSLKKDS